MYWGHGLLASKDGVGGATSWSVTDQIGSMRKWTNDTGSAGSYSAVFDAFGQVVSQSGSRPPYGFGADWAYRDDGDAGLLHVGARWYDPVIGRWTTADKYLGSIFDPLTLNRYVYCLNEPISLIDPLGLWYLKAGVSFTAIFLFWSVDVEVGGSYDSDRGLGVYGSVGGGFGGGLGASFGGNVGGGFGSFGGPGFSVGGFAGLGPGVGGSIDFMPPLPGKGAPSSYLGISYGGVPLPGVTAGGGGYITGNYTGVLDIPWI